MATQTSPDTESQRKTRVGHVLSNKMDKTVVVSVIRRYQHPKYKKYVKERSKIKAHDDANDCGVGDRVLIEEVRPMSKDKRWRVKEILERAPAV